MSAEHMARYRELFDQFDEDGGGSIDVTELGNMLRTVGQELDPADLEKIIKEYDLDESGAVDFDEFV